MRNGATNAIDPGAKIGIKPNQSPLKLEDFGLRRGDPVPDPLKNASDFFAGYADQLTGGLSQKFRQEMGYDDVVDHHSGNYQTGEIVGEIHGTALSFVSPGGQSPFIKAGILGYNAAQAAQHSESMIDNLSQGNYGQAALDGLGLVGDLGNLGKACFAAGTPLRTPDGHKSINRTELQVSECRTHDPTPGVRRPDRFPAMGPNGWSARQRLRGGHHVRMAY